MIPFKTTTPAGSMTRVLTWEEAHDCLVSDDGTGDQTQVGQRRDISGD